MPIGPWLLKTFVADTVLQATDLNQIRDNLARLSEHRHTGRPGEGSALLDTDSDTGFLDVVQIYPHFAKSTTGFTYSAGGGSSWMNAYASSTAQNDEIVWPVGLRAGTWRLETLTREATTHGIGTFYLNSDLLGTVDFYGAGGFGQRDAIAGIVVAATAWYDLKMVVATKNASSSNYFSQIEMLQLIRTGA